MPNDDLSVPKSGDGDIIFFGGDIVTVAVGAAPESVVVKDGLIVFAGGHQEALHLWRGPRTRLRDLDGQALLPGFIDAHGHLGGIGLQATIASLLAEPDGDITDIASLQEALRAFAASPVGSASAWIVGFGYDDAMLTERLHPTRDDLDAVSTTRPVLAIHQSFHLGAVNSAGLAELGYTADTPDPSGGVIRRWPDVEAPPHGEPNGVLEESAFNPASDLAVAGLPDDALAGLFGNGATAAASFGFTTVQEGGATLANLGFLRELAAQHPFPVDVVAYAQAAEVTLKPDEDPVGASPEYQGGVRAAGVKMYLDGSPQGRTAWLTEPYATPPDDLPDDYCGYPAIEDDPGRDRATAHVATQRMAGPGSRQRGRRDRPANRGGGRGGRGGPGARGGPGGRCARPDGQARPDRGVQAARHPPVVLLHAHLLLG